MSARDLGEIDARIALGVSTDEVDRVLRHDGRDDARRQGVESGRHASRFSAAAAASFWRWTKTWIKHRSPTPDGSISRTAAASGLSPGRILANGLIAIAWPAGPAMSAIAPG